MKNVSMVLNQLMKFGQLDFQRYYLKTQVRWLNTLNNIINPLESNAQWKSPLTVEKMMEIQKGVKHVIDHIKDPENVEAMRGVAISVSRLEEDIPLYYIKTNGVDLFKLGVFITTEVYGEVKKKGIFIKPGHCVECGNFFFQVKPDIKKLYCRTLCRTNAARKRG